MSKHLKKPLFLLLLLCAFTLPMISSAESGPLQGSIVKCESDPCSFKDLINVATRLIRFAVFNLAIPAGIIAIVFVGIRMVWAQGDPGAWGMAKTSLWNVLIGITLIIIAGLLVITILNLLKVKPAFILEGEIKGDTR